MLELEIPVLVTGIFLFEYVLGIKPSGARMKKRPYEQFFNVSPMGHLNEPTKVKQKKLILRETLSKSAAILFGL